MVGTLRTGNCKGSKRVQKVGGRRFYMRMWGSTCCLFLPESVRIKCKMLQQLGTVKPPGFQVDVTNRSTNIDLTNYVVSGEFDITRVSQKRRVVKYTCCPEPYPDVAFYIHIRRKARLDTLDSQTMGNSFISTLAKVFESYSIHLSFALFSATHLLLFNDVHVNHFQTLYYLYNIVFPCLMMSLLTLLGKLIFVAI